MRMAGGRRRGDRAGDDAGGAAGDRGAGRSLCAPGTRVGAANTGDNLMTLISAMVSVPIRATRCVRAAPGALFGHRTAAPSTLGDVPAPVTFPRSSQQARSHGVWEEWRSSRIANSASSPSETAARRPTRQRAGAPSGAQDCSLPRSRDLSLRGWSSSGPGVYQEGVRPCARSSREAHGRATSRPRRLEALRSIRSLRSNCLPEIR